MEFKTVIRKHLSSFPTNPYLFIGSGISRRYYGLPTWLQLLEDFYPNLKSKTDFNYYLSKCDSDPAKLASILADEFHEVWWKHPSFVKSRNTFKEQAKRYKHLPFKYELTKVITEIAKVNPIYKEEIDLLSESIIDGIITTNWDNFLDIIFKDFNSIIGQQQLLFANSFAIGEIFKIHGCCSNPESLVLTEEDYQNFNSRNAYLAAKLLTIFVEHPVIFLGYSLSDPNILEIIDSIVKCVDSNNINQLKDRLIFVTWEKSISEPTFSDNNFVLKDKSVLPIKHITLNSFTPLYDVLKSLKKRLPVKVLQKIKESVYEIIKTSRPTKNIYVGELDDLDDKSDVQFVVGVGVADMALSTQGYIAIEARDIFEDVIFNNKKFNAKLLIEHTFPKLTKGNAFIPLCKYFRELNFFTKAGSLSADAQAKITSTITFKNNMPACFMPPGTYEGKKQSIKTNCKSIAQMLQAVDKEHAVIFIPYMDKKNVDLQELQQFLATYFNANKNLNTNFRKLVCLYDYYKHFIDS